MSIKVGGIYRYRIRDYVTDTYFIIESFDGTRYQGRSIDWVETIWYFDNDGVQVATQESSDGCSFVRLVIGDDNDSSYRSRKDLS